MTAGATPASVVNQSLAQISAQYTLSGTLPDFDGSAAGLAAGILYAPAVVLLLRQQDYEFSRNDVALTVAGISAPYPWSDVYLYPSDCLKIRQVKPAVWNQNDPFPTRWTEMEQMISGVQTRVIACDVSGAVLTYTTSAVTESEWDSIFQEAFVRLLGSELAAALGGRFDLSEKMLGVSGGLVGIGAGKDS
jgi:hypothetical protein